MKPSLCPTHSHTSIFHTLHARYPIINLNNRSCAKKSVLYMHNEFKTQHPSSSCSPWPLATMVGSIQSVNAVYRRRKTKNDQDSERGGLNYTNYESRPLDLFVCASSALWFLHYALRSLCVSVWEQEVRLWLH